MTTGETSNWIKNNLWNLVITFVTIVIAFITMQLRISALENKVNQYPSQDYFDLKFKIIDSQLFDLKIQLENHINKEYEKTKTQ
ncbi:MAG: hypothetical protein WC549_00565 [Actinomycetota bacterium]